MFNSTAGLYPLDASNAPLPTCANQQCLQHCQMASGRQSCHQLRTTDELEALAGLLGAALEQGDRALPGAGCPRVLLWPPSSCCPPHRVRSPRSQGDMAPWSNPTLLDHVLFSRAREDLLLVLPADGVCKATPERWPSMLAEWGARHPRRANYVFWTQTCTQGSSDEGWWWRWEEKGGGLWAGASPGILCNQPADVRVAFPDPSCWCSWRAVWS